MRFGVRSTTASDRGSVTAETAVVLPVLVFVLVCALWLVAGASAALRCGDAARNTARALARGESMAQAQRSSAADAPQGATWTVSRSGGLVHVRVEAKVQPFGGLGDALPALPVHSVVSMADEQVQL